MPRRAPAPSPVRVGFTGTQKGMTGQQRKSLIHVLHWISREGEVVQFHHGDCIGADAEAHQLVLSLERWPYYKEFSFVRRPWKSSHPLIILHPPTDPKKRAFCKADITRPRAPYLKRNHEIVDETDVLVACPGESEEKLRSGTWATARYARSRGRTLFLVFPDGSTQIGTPEKGTHKWEQLDV